MVDASSACRAVPATTTHPAARTRGRQRVARRSPTPTSIVVPWELLRDWLRDVDLLGAYDGTMDFGGRAAGRFDEILGPPTDADIVAGWLSVADWLLATAPSVEG